MNSNGINFILFAFKSYESYFIFLFFLNIISLTTNVFKIVFSEKSKVLIMCLLKRLSNYFMLNRERSKRNSVKCTVQCKQWVHKVQPLYFIFFSQYFVIWEEEKKFNTLSQHRSVLEMLTCLLCCNVHLFFFFFFTKKDGCW